MHRIRVAAILAVALSLSGVPAFADVTIKTTMATTGGPVAMEMSMTTYVKGQKLRTDVKGMNQDVSLIVDVATREQLLVNHGTKQVTPFDAQTAASAMPMSFGDATMSLKPTGTTKEVLGRTCAGFALEISMPMTMQGETITMVLSGPVWIATGGPGVADFRAFYKAALDAGLSVASPLQQGPQARSLVEMQKAFADQGIPFEQEVRMAFQGSGQMAQAMSAMSMGMTTKVASISADVIPADTFTVPADYSRK